MCKRLFFFVLLFGLQAFPVQAAPDFFGVKMKSEDFARNVGVQENIRVPDFSNDRPGTDKRVYAYGYTSTFLGRGRGLSIRVYNHSEKDISTERLFRECTVVTRDGRRYERSDSEMEWRRDVLLAGQDATFNMIFPGLDLRRDDVRMIIFSFGLGETSIYLFPLGPRESVKIAPPPVKKAPEKRSIDKKAQNKPVAAKKEEKKTEGDKHPLISQYMTPVKIVQSFFRGLGQAADEKDRPISEKPCCEIPEDSADAKAIETEAPVRTSDDQVPPIYPLVKSSQVIDNTSYNFSPEFRKAVQEAESQTRQIVYQERPWSLDNPDQMWQRTEAFRVKPEAPRATAEVVIVNPAYGFIVFNAGLVDGVQPNSIVAVLRNGRRIGKVMVTKVRDKISAGMILPEWRTKDDIKIGDVAALHT